MCPEKGWRLPDKRENTGPPLANHPVIHTPPAATSWASCLFAVSYRYIMYLEGTLSRIKKPAEAGL
ncbi:hypothetical protein B1086_003944 [Salmonella enterica subsp. enterica serovar Arechavaleta]|nr:hypothetical protein [Salmonella enterica subsp. enterica serovar Arechavaleta]